jgi:propionyl-CoA carboxylase alpha chain
MARKKKAPFKKILVANRGEIACRILRSAKRLGIKTVAVFSEADVSAPHVEMADEAIALGPPPASESYLRIDKMIEACKKTGAQAVHPGYGFLSENTAFAEALDAAGVTFVGPPAGAIAAMGDKIQSKKLAQKAGVSTVPGHPDVVPNADKAVEVSRSIGFPVMIKASAGGGGKGMRIAHDEKQTREGFRSAVNEARSSFGDERIFIEKFIEQPRHIEIQVLADAHGKVLHLGERECSIQRRHQKVIEEAPSPFLDPETRAAMGAQAVALAAAVDYRSAGTVEFIVDKDKNFYFLEMNTRLQVEHPVTEAVVGLDLVEWMLRIAAGEPLDLEQDDIVLDGWSIEARIYAEDPLRGFLPSIGRLTRYREPQGEGIRVDSGVIEGSEISMFYDPMIAKLVTSGSSRDAAIERMQEALDRFYIRGIDHNISFLSSVLNQDRFRAGALSTDFIADLYPDGFSQSEPGEALLRDLVAVAAVAEAERAQPYLSSSHERLRTPAHHEWVAIVGKRQLPLTLTVQEEGFQVEDEAGQQLIVSDWRAGEPLFIGAIDDRPLAVQVERRGAAWKVSGGGASLEVLVVRPRIAELAALMPEKEAPDLSKFLLSPMPGLLVSLAVEVGQEIKAGEELAVVEAMKMENVLRATSDGKIAEIHAKPGDSLAVDQAILEFA